LPSRDSRRSDGRRGQDGDGIGPLCHIRRLKKIKENKGYLIVELSTGLVRLEMENRERSRTAGSTGSATGGSSGTPGRAGYDQDENARVADTSPGDVRTGGQATEDRLGGPGFRRTAAERGSGELEEIPGMQEQVRRWEAGTRGTATRGAYGGALRESEDAGMWQTSRMLREEREEGDPEMMRREEDLHARQMNLGARERSLREREAALQEREQNLHQRQPSIMGRGLGATDYQDYRIRNDR